MKPNILVSTKDISREEWLEWRKKGIGGSDVAAIAGVNQYRSAIDVYLDKTGQTEPQPDNRRMKMGRILEPLIADDFTEATGIKVHQVNSILQHPQYPWMLANIDRRCVGQKVGLECKTTEVWNRDKLEGEQVPDDYYLQCQHYMAVTDYEGWYLAVFIGFGEFKYYYIERNEDIINKLIEVEHQFWNENVLAKVMPAVDGAESTDEALSKMYPESENTTIELPQHISTLNQIDALEKQVEPLKQEIDRLKQTIKADMGVNEVAHIGTSKATWKTTKGRTKWANVAKENLDLSTINLDDYRGQGSRKFEIK